MKCNASLVQSFRVIVTSFSNIKSYLVTMWPVNADGHDSVTRSGRVSYVVPDSVTRENATE